MSQLDFCFPEESIRQVSQLRVRSCLTTKLMFLPTQWVLPKLNPMKAHTHAQWPRVLESNMKNFLQRKKISRRSLTKHGLPMTSRSLNHQHFRCWWSGEESVKEHRWHLVATVTQRLCSDF